jgi:hypothetical protein
MRAPVGPLGGITFSPLPNYRNILPFTAAITANLENNSPTRGGSLIINQSLAHGSCNSLSQEDANVVRQK